MTLMHRRYFIDKTACLPLHAQVVEVMLYENRPCAMVIVDTKQPVGSQPALMAIEDEVELGENPLARWKYLETVMTSTHVWYVFQLKETL